MRIACPSCAAVYEVPASRLTPRKMVRCARCGGEWVPEPEPEASVPAPAPAVLPPVHSHWEPATDVTPPVTAMDRLKATAAASPSRAGLLGAWVLTFVVLSGAVAAAYAWREPIVRAWPPLGRILPTMDATATQPARTAVAKPE